MIPPGGTIGILGGGQLGRMLAMAAAQLGYRCHAYDPNGESPAADVSAGFTCAPWSDRNALAHFAAGCDVVTYEFENVPVGPLAFIEPGKLLPSARALEVAQDRLSEKSFCQDQGGRPAPYVQVDSAEDLGAAIGRIGAPGILKTRREGYDGKGQWRIDSERDAQGLRLPSAGRSSTSPTPVHDPLGVVYGSRCAARPRGQPDGPPGSPVAKHGVELDIQPRVKPVRVWFVCVRSLRTQQRAESQCQVIPRARALCSGLGFLWLIDPSVSSGSQPRSNHLRRV